MRWTPDMVTTLREHWGRRTARQIGDMVGKSKNAVLGKVKRLGMSGPINMSGKALNADRKPPPRVVCRRQLSNFTSGCQWIHGEPRERDFCGAPTRPGSSYCEAHHAICWEAPRERVLRMAEAG